MRAFVETLMHISALLVACFTLLRANTVGPPIGEAYDLFPDLVNCGKTLGCIRTPEGCKKEDCVVLVTWKIEPANPAEIIVEIGGTNPDNDFLGLSFCLSNDAALGDDSCMVCELDNGHVTTVLSYINSAGKNELITNTNNVNEFVKVDAVFRNRYVWCKSKRPLRFPTPNTRIFDLQSVGGEWLQYYPTIASQKIFDGVYQPASKRVIWSEKISVNEPDSINSGSQRWTLFGILPLLAVISHLL